ncbi:hypothetical protein M0804_007459 [Polistes exclamans]|nr:hypothetical protein M0804_007459 [Polistes exclamans]
MSLKGSSYYKQHFLYSNRLVQLIMGLRPNQSSYDQLFRWCTVSAYVLPMIVHQVQKLDKYIKRDYEQLSSKKELFILNKYTKQNKLFTIIIVGFCYLYAISLTMPSILSVLLHILGFLDNVKLTLPLPVNNIFNGGPLYYSLLIYQIIAIFVLLTICSVCYSTYLVVIQHACIQFNIIIFKIRQPFNEQNYEKEFWYSKTHQEEWEWIVDIIKRYKRITKLVTNNLLYSFDILQLSVILKNTNGMFECFIIIAGSILTIYANFYFGQMLIDHNSATVEELCQVPFYVLSIKTQKLLLFVIARSMRPCEISIGGIFVASHEIFSELVQRAFSFAMVYYNML